MTDMKAKNILVLNMGMKSIRSIIFRPDGEKLAYAARSRRTNGGKRPARSSGNRSWMSDARASAA